MMKYRFEKEGIEPLIGQAVNEIIPYAEAKRLNVRGRSTMSKAELQRAVDRRT
jgi:hypothetical protein